MKSVLLFLLNQIEWIVDYNKVFELLCNNLKVAGYSQGTVTTEEVFRKNLWPPKIILDLIL